MKLKPPVMLLAAALVLGGSGAALAENDRYDRGRGHDRGNHYGHDHRQGRNDRRESNHRYDQRSNYHRSNDGRRYSGHREVHVVNRYNYVYYPHRNVYYAPSERVWYVRDRHDWRPHYSRPWNDLNAGVNVVLNIPLY